MHSFFSIIVPTYNRPEALLGCLDALSSLAWPRDRFEVVVVDDGSREAVGRVVGAVDDAFDITLVRQSNAGPAAARNHGARRARGEFLAFTDDDCRPQPDWLVAFARGLEHEPGRLMGGHTVNALYDNPYSAASQLLIDYLYDYHGRTDSAAYPFFASNNLALSAARFWEVGGFDERFPLAAGEDREFCRRWVAHGFAMRYVSDAVVQHAHELTFRRFWRQHLNYGRGAHHFHRRREPGEAIKFEPFSFYRRLVAFPFQAPRRRSPVLLAALMTLSQIANVAGFALESYRRG